MAIEIPEGVDLPGDLEFDPNHPHLLSVDAHINGESVDWWFDGAEMQLAADCLDDAGFHPLIVAEVRKLEVTRHAFYCEGWGLASGGMLHYFVGSELSRPLCGRVQQQYGISSWISPADRLPPHLNHFCKYCQKLEKERNA